MKSDLPKSLHKIAGRPMIGWLLESLAALDPEKIVVVTGPNMRDLQDYISPHISVIQEKPLGTADAVKAAMPDLDGFDGDVLIVLGDMPLMSAGMLQGLIEVRHQGDKTALSVLGVHMENPPAYGRLVIDEDTGTLTEIIEDKDCTPQQREIKICNTGAFCADGAKLSGWLSQIGNDNAQGEYYVTDLPVIAKDDGYDTRVAILYDSAEAAGVNSRADLAVMEKIMQQRLRERAMENGATLIDPETVYFSYDTQIGRDVVIEPNVFFGPGVSVADHVHIKSFSHMEGSVIEAHATIGPQARLRPGAKIGEGSRIGNFVEVKNATLGAGVKAGHLAYIGDADVDADVNFSCGAITVNYDGFDKHRTVIGEGVMIGSNVNLVAPVQIGKGAFVAAGSTITGDVTDDSLAVAREKSRIIEGWAAKNRNKKKVR